VRASTTDSFYAWGDFPQYVNDWSIKNYHWALCCGVFGRRDIGRIEREFLDVIDWELSVTEADILKHFDHISACPSKPKRVPVPILPSESEDVEMDECTWEDSPVSSASPTPPPQTPSTAVSPSNQPTHIHSPSNEASEVRVTVREVTGFEQDQSKHSIFRLFHPSSNKQPTHPHERV
jgi:hypothetical protein